jgi:Rrf2 family protein
MAPEFLNMLSTTAEYALRIMVTLTESDAPSVTSEKIARRAHVPTDYAVKVLQLLGRANLVRAQRGRGGGFRSICDPNVTSLLDVVNAIDPLKRIKHCPLDRAEHSDKLCPLHQAIDDVMAQLESSLRGMTLAAVVENAPDGALCKPNGNGATPVTVSAVNGNS